MRSGSHLVVHGPPGTGKSQTIANLVATLAADGKRVLFVAEKRAAIDAVVGRLDRVGLGDLVLDLHAGAHGRRRRGPRARRRARPARRGEPTRRPRRAGCRRRRLPRHGAGRRPPHAAAERLGEHVRALHDRREPWGVSLHDVQEAVSAFAALPTPPRSRVRLRGDALAALDRDGAARAAAVGHDRRVARRLGRSPGADDPWFGAGIRTADEAIEARERVERLDGGGVDDTARTLAEVFRGIQLPETPTTGDWARVLATVGEVRDTLETFRPEVFDIPLGDLVDGHRQRGLPPLGRLRPRVARALAAASSGPRPAAARSSAGRPARRPGRGERAAGRLAPARRVGRAARDPRRARPGPGGPRRARRRPRVARRAAAAARRATPLASGTALAPARPRPRDAARPGRRARRRGRAARRRARGARRRSTSSRHPACGPLVDDLRARAVPAEQAAAEVEWVWWSSLAEEVALRDPQRRGARRARADPHGRRVRRGGPGRGGGERGSRARRRRRPGGGRRARAPRAGDAPAGGGGPGAPARAPARPRAPLPRPRDGRAAVLGDEPARRRVGAAARGSGSTSSSSTRRRRCRRPRRSRRSRGRARSSSPATRASCRRPRSSRPSPTATRRPWAPTRRSPRASSRSSTCSPPPCRAAGCRWHYRSLDERLIAFANARGLRGVARDVPRHRHRPGRAPRARRGPRHRGRGGGRRRDDDDRGRPGRRARARARPHPPRPLARRHRARHHARHPGRGGPAPRASRASTTGVLEFFDEDRPEAFFVKNLERVQGDERDDVILTVGYGKTPHGRVLHRFGPLNIEGGERRLNVAITRARRSMTVVSSIAAGDLDPARLRARGALMLRDFLAYAAGGPVSRSVRAEPRRRMPCRPDARPGARSVVLADLARRLRGTGSSSTRRSGRRPTRSTSPSRTRAHRGRLAAGGGVGRAAVRRDAHDPGPRPAARRAARAAGLAPPAGVVDRRLPGPGAGRRAHPRGGGHREAPGD